MPPRETIIFSFSTVPIIKPNISILYVFRLGPSTWTCIPFYAVPKAVELLFLRMRVMSGTTTRWDLVLMHTWEIRTLSPHCFYACESIFGTTTRWESLPMHTWEIDTLRLLLLVVYTVSQCKIVYV